MKKILKRISAIFLTVLLVFSSVACSSDKKTKKESWHTGNHVFQSKETNEYVVKNGKTDYKLVYPSGGTSAEMATALDEFIYFFEKATGARIKKQTDEGLTHSENGKYISLGDTTLLQTSGLKVDKSKLELEGSRILTKDDTIFIVGNTDRGTLYGVYTFLEYNFNFDCYTDRVYTIDEVDEFKLKEYNVTDIPDFPERTYHLSYINNSPVFEEYDRNQYRIRMRLESDHYRLIPIYYNDGEYIDESKIGYSASGENAPVTVLPWSRWRDEHPKWYSTRSGQSGDRDTNAQLCYTARGDKAEYELMVQKAFEKLKYSIETRPTFGRFKYAKTITCGIADNNNSCKCEACGAMTDKYGGAEVASQVIFTNDVADKLKAWQESLSKDDPAYVEGLELMFYAYGWCTQAPAKQNKKGEWEAIGEEMKLRDNVCVEIAYIGSSTQRSMFDEDAPNFVNQVEAWTALGGAGIFYFMYNLNYANESYFYDSYNWYSTEGYRFLSNRNQTGVIVDGYGRGFAMTGWYSLKVYLDSKMYWNTSLDVNELIDKWFKGVFKDAAPQMMNVFMQTRLHTLSYQERFGLNVVGKTCQVLIEKKDYYPLPVLNSWIAGYDAALAIAEKYKKADPVTYDLICRYIEAEALSPLISKARLYYNELAATDKAVLRDRLMHDLVWLDAAGIKLDEFGKAYFGDWVKTL